MLALAIALSVLASLSPRAEAAAPELLADETGAIGLLIRPLVSAPGRQRLPAVLLVHDSLGYDPRSEAYTRQLTGASLVVLEIERQLLSAEGAGPAEEEPGRLSRALGALAGLPDVDPNRMGALGFGEGARALALAADGLPIRALVLLYPGCGSLASALTDDGLKTGQPFAATLLMHGTADPANTAADCATLAGLLAERSPHVRLETWPGATYGWDIPKPSHAPTARFPAPGGGRALPIHHWPELADLSATRAAAFLDATLAGGAR